jgi:NADP-dependent 3-hydroxy acid dehydrogenase YdfG
MKNFKYKTVVITGAGSGIGMALALAFAKEGAHLALNDFNEKTLRETVELLKPFQSDVFENAFDVSNREAMFSFADEVVKKFGQVDVMINNAGIGLGDYPFHEMDLDMFEKVMSINFNGVLYGSRAFILHLLKQPEAVLVNVSSVFGLTGIAYSTAYCASKFAVHGLNQSLMQEYVNTSLFIHSVHPGGVNTNISENSIDYKANNTHDDFKKQFLKISPDDAAKTIINGIKKKKRKILIGAEAYQLDIAVRMFPYLGGRIVNKTIQKKMEAAKRK